MEEQKTTPSATDTPQGLEPPRQNVSVSIRLQPVEHSEQPIFSNFTAVQAGNGVVFIDFGFLDPQIMTTLARLGQPGVPVPEAVPGKLACRMALSIDTMAHLADQLNRLIRDFAQSRPPRAQPSALETEETSGITH